MNFYDLENPVDWSNIEIISKNNNGMRVFAVLLRYEDQTYKMSYNQMMDNYPLLFACDVDGEITNWIEVLIDMYEDSDLYNFRDQFKELIDGGNHE